MPPPLAPFVGVALDLPVERIFTYRVPEDLRSRVRVGQRVRVPFRGRGVLGLVAEIQESCDLERVLDIEALPDDGPLLPPDLLSLGRFVARYYGCAVGEALAAMVPRGVRTRGKGAVRKRVRLAKPAAEALAAADAFPAGLNARARVLRLLVRDAEATSESDGVLLADLSRRAKTTRGPISALEKDGFVVVTEEAAGADPLVLAATSPLPAGEAEAPVPTEAQRVALEAVRGAVAAGTYRSFLLLGVTGSGKTEVYLEAIRSCRDAGKQAIVLVPEIALTPQTVRRFRARFERVAVLHSAMTEADRAGAWRAIRAGEADVVIGPRSAVFAPVPRLGLLVIDEEHETSFKQQNAPRYHARDVGLVRAKEAGAVVVLGSATPSLESWKNAKDGRHALLSLPARVEGRPLPPVRLIDLRKDGERRGSGRWLSRTLVERLHAVLAKKEQAILFLNRRGFATSVACPRCGFVLRCPGCDAALTYHRAGAVALCHLCGHEDRPPSACPDCAFQALRFRGAGTQTVEEELATEFPGVVVARMDSDTMVDRAAYEDVLSRFGRGEVQVLLGTQMIAKGHHFPNVTLVGVVSADTSLSVPDFRAAERTFSLLAQVAGRAGRGDGGGEVFVQTLHPDEPAVRFALTHAFEAFAESESKDREAHGYPPFRRLLRVLLRGKDAQALVDRGETLAHRLSEAGLAGVEWLGPATPAMARLEGYDRRHLLVKARDPAGIRAAMEVLRAKPGPSGGVEEQYDVDPVGLL